jgi:5-methylcytosine-specific restriction protein A
MRGRRLQALRHALFRAQPWCQHCLGQGRQILATIRDHVVPLAEGGRDDEGNVQALCQICSDTKTAAEAQRGMRRIR